MFEHIVTAVLSCIIDLSFFLCFYLSKSSHTLKPRPYLPTQCTTQGVVWFWSAQKTPYSNNKSPLLFQSSLFAWMAHESPQKHDPVTLSPYFLGWMRSPVIQSSGYCSLWLISLMLSVHSVALCGFTADLPTQLFHITLCYSHLCPALTGRNWNYSES